MTAADPLTEPGRGPAGGVSVFRPRRLGPRTLRGRLALGGTVVAGVALGLLSVTALILFARSLRASLDESLHAMAQGIVAASRQAPPPGRSLEDALDDTLGPGAARRLFELLDPRGRPDPRLARRLGPRLPLSPAALQRAARGLPTFEDVAVGTTNGRALVRILTEPVFDQGFVAGFVQTALPLAPVEAATRQFGWTLLAMAPVALVAAAAGGWWLAGRALAPVDAMTAAVRRIEAEDLSRRLDDPGTGDEIARLATVANDLLARLEAAFEAARRFSADAAHELRTPLTILRGELELALDGLRRARSAAGDASAPVDPVHDALTSCLEEVERLTSLIGDLLFLARSDAGALEQPTATIRIADLFADVLPALEALGEPAGVRIDGRADPGLVVRGHPDMLFRLLLNLGENAVKFSPRGGEVTLRAVREQPASSAVGADPQMIRIEVSDQGPGVPPAQRERIFARFHRSPNAGPRAGSGLGLAIAQSIAEAHGGQIQATDGAAGGGLFRVRLPAAVALRV